MTDHTDVDVVISGARSAADANIAEVAEALRRATHGIRGQMAMLATTRDDLIRMQQRVEVEIEVLHERARRLEEVTLPAVESGDVDVAPPLPGPLLDPAPDPTPDGAVPDAEPTDEMAEIALDEAPWGDPEIPRPERLLSLVTFHGRVTGPEAVAALHEVGDDASDDAIAADLDALLSDGRLVRAGDAYVVA